MIAKELGAQHLKAYSDSQLAYHILNESEAKEESMNRYLQKVRDLTSTFYSFSIQQVSREENARIDAISKLATYAPHNLRAEVFFEVIEEPSIYKPTSVLQLDPEPY